MSSFQAPREKKTFSASKFGVEHWKAKSQNLKALGHGSKLQSFGAQSIAKSSKQCFRPPWSKHFIWEIAKAWSKSSLLLQEHDLTKQETRKRFKRKKKEFEAYLQVYLSLLPPQPE
jgi:hypothetical protein